MITQEFDLNLIPESEPVVVHVDQYDHGTGRFIINLYDGDSGYAPNGTVSIQGSKPDGHGFAYDATLEGNVVTADLTEQMSAVAGDTRAQIVVTESDGRTGTFVFIIRVQKSALPDDSDLSESDYSFIEEAIEQTQLSVQECQNCVDWSQAHVAAAANFAREGEAWAKGTKNGTPVSPTDPQYHNNSKYWAEKSQEYAQGGLHWKNSIPFASIPTQNMEYGDMYNITDDFTTDTRFEEGPGIEVEAGTNIVWSSHNKWDLLAVPGGGSGSGVTSFKGRTGAVVPTTGDYLASQIADTDMAGTSGYVHAFLNRGGGIWTAAVSCLVGDTSVSITHGISDLALHPENYSIAPHSETASGAPIGFKKIEVVGSQVQVTFSSALTEAASIKLHITRV